MPAMDPLAAMASVIDIISNAFIAASTAVRLVNNIRHEKDGFEDLRGRLSNVKTTIDHLRVMINNRERRIGRNGGLLDFRQEEGDLSRQAKFISQDCVKCVSRLENICNIQGNSLVREIKSQAVQKIKKAEIDNLELRIQTNLANMQLLLSCLNMYAHDNEVERFDNDIQHIQHQIKELSELQNRFADILEQSIEQARASKHSAESLPVQANRTFLVDETNGLDVDEDDGRYLIQTTHESIQKATDLLERWSSSGSESRFGSESRDDDGTESTKSRATGDHRSSAISPRPPSSHNPEPEILAQFFDEYIALANQGLKEGNYVECEQNLKSAIETGIKLFDKNGQAFEQCFELQLRLANVYQYQGKTYNALNLIFDLMQRAIENKAEYMKITPLRMTQLLHARAKFFLEKHDTHGITLLDLDKIAMTAYTSAIELQGQNEDATYAGDTSSQLLNECAITWGQVLQMRGDQGGLNVLMSRHPALGEFLKRRASCTSYSTEFSNEGTSQALTGVTTPPTPLERASPTLSNDAPMKSRGNAESDMRESLTGVIGRDSGGMTPLHDALRGVTCDTAAIVKLIRQGIDVNAADPDGDTALHYAVRYHHPKAAEILLDFGKANLEVANRRGKTPAHLAVSLPGGTDILSLLIFRGAAMDPSQIPPDMRCTVDSLFEMKKKKQDERNRRGSQASTAQQNGRRESDGSSQSSRSRGRLFSSFRH